MKTALAIAVGLCGASLSLEADSRGGNSPKPGIDLALSDNDYESTATVQLLPRPPEIEADLLNADLQPRNRAARMKWSEYTNKQIALIQSKENIRGAILAVMPDLLDDHVAIVRRVKEKLLIQQIKGTDLFKITVRHSDKKLSRDLANKVADGYLSKVNLEGKKNVAILHRGASVGVRVDDRHREGK